MAGKQGKKRVRDLALSMGLVVLAAAVIYVFVPHDDSKDPVKAVDYRVELVTARRAAPYPVAAPEGLPKSWKPTSVRFDATPYHAWHLGFAAPDGEYVAVEQSTEQPEAFVDRASQGARRTSSGTRVEGRTWQRYHGSHYDALVARDEGATTVVTGTGTFEELVAMARSLKASRAS